MARYFEISSNTTTIKLDSQGKGSLQYKVKNVSGAPTDGRVVLVSLPETNPQSGPVQKGWVKLGTPADHYFERDEQAVFAVAIEVPAKDRAAAGTYTFRLDAVLSAVPDRGDQGPGAAFTLEAPPLPPRKNWLWLVLAIAAVLILGIGTWLALRSKGTKVPDVSGKSVADAITALNAAKFVVDPAVTTAAGPAEAVNKVIATTPAAGAEAADGSSVHLTVGAATAPVKIAVPNVSGKLLVAAVTSLTSAKLTVDPTVDSLSGDDAMVGKVVKETPAAGTGVAENASIHLTVGTAKVQVPNLKGMAVASAQSMLSSLQLGSTVISENDPSVTAGIVTKQAQEPGTRVDSGTNIQITVTPQQVTVPNIKGRIPQQAALALKAANLRLGAITFCGGLLVQSIEQQVPAEGAKVNAGSSVAVTNICPFANNPSPVFASLRARQTIAETTPYVQGLNNAAK